MNQNTLDKMTVKKTGVHVVLFLAIKLTSLSIIVLMEYEIILLIHIIGQSKLKV